VDGSRRVERICGVERVIVIVESSQHFSIFTSMMVESQALVNLEFVERDYLRLAKSGVDKVLRLRGTAPNFCMFHRV